MKFHKIFTFACVCFKQQVLRHMTKIQLIANMQFKSINDANFNASVDG